MKRLIIVAALAVALVLLFSSCKGSGGTPAPWSPPAECVQSCSEQRCLDDGGCGPCQVGSGCFIPTGFCVPDANGVCPPVVPPACTPVACTPVDCQPVDCVPVPVDPPVCEPKFPPTHPCCNGKHLGDKHCDGVICHHEHE